MKQIRAKIFLDMNGVMYNWNGRAGPILGFDEKDPYTRIMLKSDPDGVEKIIKPDVVFQTIENMGASFWEGIQPLPWAHDLYNYCEKKSHGNVCFLTSPGKWADAPSGKIRAIRRDFPGAHILMGKPKFFCADARAILIDDHPKNARKFADWGGSDFLWPSQYRIEDGEITIPRLLDELDLLIDKAIERVSRSA